MNFRKLVLVAAGGLFLAVGLSFAHAGEDHGPKPPCCPPPCCKDIPTPTPTPEQPKPRPSTENHGGGSFSLAGPCSCTHGWLDSGYTQAHPKDEGKGPGACQRLYKWYAKVNPKWNRDVCGPEMTDPLNKYLGSKYWWGGKIHKNPPPASFTPALVSMVLPRERPEYPLIQ
jgi:hypothetical protein